MVSIADSSRLGKEAALRDLASGLIDSYMSIPVSTARAETTFYLIRLEKRMVDGSLYDVGGSTARGNDIDEAVKRGGSIAARLTLGDKLIKELSEN